VKHFFVLLIFILVASLCHAQIDPELKHAVEAGQVDSVEALLTKGTDLNAHADDGWTLLHIAAAHGHSEVVTILLSRGANVNVKDSRIPPRPTVMVQSVGNVPIEKTEEELRKKEAELISKWNPNEKVSEGWTPLHVAAQSGRAAVAALLISAGAEVNAKNNEGHTPLHLATAHDQKTVVALLLSQGAELGAKDNEGRIPLHLAIAGLTEYRQTGEGVTQIALAMPSLELATLLLSKGSDPGAQDNEGDTPLHRAAEVGRVEMVNLLLSAGVNPDVRNKHRSTPLHLSVNTSPLREFDVTRRVIVSLISRGADPNARDGSGFTALSNLARFGMTDDSKLVLAEFLISKGADPNAADEDGTTPLHHADTKMAKLLLGRGADPNVKDKRGRTPLHEAAGGIFESDREVAALLLAKGADPNVADNNGRTPLQEARSVRNKQVEEILRKYGAKK